MLRALHLTVTTGISESSWCSGKGVGIKTFRLVE